VTGTEFIELLLKVTGKCLKKRLRGDDTRRECGMVLYTDLDGTRLLTVETPDPCLTRNVKQKGV
jgi:hypothetical protein